MWQNTFTARINIYWSYVMVPNEIHLFGRICISYHAARQSHSQIKILLTFVFPPFAWKPCRNTDVLIRTSTHTRTQWTSEHKERTRPMAYLYVRAVCLYHPSLGYWPPVLCLCSFAIKVDPFICLSMRDITCKLMRTHNFNATEEKKRAAVVTQTCGIFFLFGFPFFEIGG